MKTPLRFLRLLFLAGLLCASDLFATFTEHDLQQDLAYARSTDLDTDLEAIDKKLIRHPALVLDLRQAAATEKSAATLASLLARPAATPRFVRILLLGKDSSRALMKELTTDLPGVVTISAQSELFTPDIKVAVTAEEDRIAYEALTGGLALDKLLSGSAPQKIRYDEASLVREHSTNSARQPITDEPEEEATSPTPATSTLDAQKPAPQPVDRVLQRAVQLHRTLLALKKL
jgi:hypothetical protein